MLALKIDIIEYISADQPGFVEARFKDAWDKEFIFHDKASVFSSKDLNRNSKYPQSGVIACILIEDLVDKKSRKIITINTEKPWDVPSTDGIYNFDVLPEQLTHITDRGISEGKSNGENLENRKELGN